MTAENREGVQVIRRAASILRLLAGNPAGLSLGAIAAAVVLPRSTVQRIVDALQADDLVEPAGPGGGTRLGPAIAFLAAALVTEPLILLREEMQRLREATGETIALTALQDGHPTIIDAAPGSQELRIVLTLGTRLALTTSSAQSMLADPPGTLAFDEEGTTTGVSAVSAAFRQKGSRYALTVIGPADRFRRRRDSWIAELEKTRARLAGRLD
ncbi:helix-turn-helix domain-containing protein [Lichenicola cladoniae]|uniref:Helix-turn-helix domain-containing protein n=1 Tax=Lichenicola cladoniae TaxID=1484109 RepID=A0A6M8HRJ2_9PROT|nr:helix-turn-helix domain-containing protein [Lichenicola cladoniae]NPD65901.1 helix-turn-helix domain-containing protein [Acetobacteraceae bacterium]QKE91103.1 helix-turn-helix domain-containing protein [Lichenicola cladoniae]